MKIAITIWGNRISPVFDAATKLLVVEISSDEIVNQTIRTFQAAKFNLFQQLLVEMDSQLLICGAICNHGVKRFESIGVDVTISDEELSDSDGLTKRMKHLLESINTLMTN